MASSPVTKMEISLEDDNVIKFQNGQVVGQGRFGYVVKAVAERYVALKHVRFDDDHPRRSKREAQILKELRHRHIARIYNVMPYATATDIPELILELEFCCGGSLHQAIQKQADEPFPPEQVRSWMIQLGRAINYLHQLSIVHRDIKPDNIMLTRTNIIKLTDFGLSKLLGDQMSSSYGDMAGTRPYMAPEKYIEELQGDLPKDTLEMLNDVWAFGVVGFELAALRRPFVVTPEGICVIEAFKRLFQEQQTPPEPLSDEPWTGCGHKQLVEGKLLAYRPQNRLSMALLIQDHYFADNIPSSVPEVEPHELHDRFVECSHKLQRVRSKKKRLTDQLSERDRELQRIESENRQLSSQLGRAEQRLWQLEVEQNRGAAEMAQQQGRGPVQYYDYYKSFKPTRTILCNAPSDIVAMLCVPTQYCIPGSPTPGVAMYDTCRYRLKETHTFDKESIFFTTKHPRF